MSRCKNWEKLRKKNGEDPFSLRAYVKELKVEIFSCKVCI
jgi:hypothetical protein